MIWKNLQNVALKPFAKGELLRQAGMTIIEILIVIALIGTIMTIVASNVMQSSEGAKVDLASIAAKSVGDALQLYKVSNNKFPTTDEGLKALIEQPASAKSWRGPYLDAEKLKDPWGNDFAYESAGARAFKITSGGPDGEIGNTDDIVYPKEAANAAAPETK